jgi:hypothetical protein
MLIICSYLDERAKERSRAYDAYYKHLESIRDKELNALLHRYDVPPLTEKQKLDNLFFFNNFLDSDQVKRDMYLLNYINDISRANHL